MTKYETTIVLDSLLKPEDIQVTVAKIETFIKNNGGVILLIEDWGKKRLAYEINRKNYGNYHHIQFEGPSTLPKLLEREFKLEEALLRYLTVKTEKHILRSQRNAPKEPVDTTAVEESPDSVETAVKAEEPSGEEKNESADA